ncbi:MAG: hypothetical protein FWB88_03765 [Defluviitaleaceae bacterium]|nr:hypothetical protein [Defluviitaleaceae bacterium]MCL2239065.1 hypothetical protein [Defluviitaleaceae bacterium]
MCMLWTILRNKRGLSLIFVLVAMLVLLALSAGAFTAAGLSHRAVFAQQARNQRMLYVESMGLVLRDALNEERPPGGTVATLTEIILEAVYEAYRAAFEAHWAAFAAERTLFEIAREIYWDALADWEYAGSPLGYRPIAPLVPVFANMMPDDMLMEDVVIVLAADAPGEASNAGYEIIIHVSSENFALSLLGGGFSVQMYDIITLQPLPYLTRIPAEIVFNGYVTITQRLFFAGELEMEAMTTFHFNYGRREAAGFGVTLPLIPEMPITAIELADFSLMSEPILERDYDLYGYPGYLPILWDRWTVKNHEIF